MILVLQISPQFSEVPATVKKGRRGLSRRKQLETNTKAPCTCGHSILETTAHRPPSKNKFKALKFIADRTQYVSTIEDIQFSDIDEKSESEHSPILKRKVRRRSLRRSAAKCDRKSPDCDVQEVLSPQYDGIHTPPCVDPQTPPYNHTQSFVSNNLPQSPLCGDSPVKQLFAKQTEESEKENANNTISNSDFNRSYNKRLRPKHVLVKYFDTTITGTPINTSLPRVLVCDTPEADYGLRYRERRRKRRYKR